MAQVLVSKYADHLPLYRQARIYARQGINRSMSYQLADPLACHVNLPVSALRNRSVVTAAA